MKDSTVRFVSRLLNTTLLKKPLWSKTKGQVPAEPIDWHELISEYRANQHHAEKVQSLRFTFLQLLLQDFTILKAKEAAQFLVNEIEFTDFEMFDWQQTEEILYFCNRLYTFPFADETLRQQVRDHVRDLLGHALRMYEEAGEHEQLFTAVQDAPLFTLWNDEELIRLRHLAYRYEVKRVSRNRRWLTAYLIIQALLVTVAFPVLFINAENGALQAKVEQMAGVELGDEGYRLLSYMDALYWSIITATSIGYGDITPTTTTGRIIAAVLGTMGVITIGIVAGLMLDWITPRHID